MAVGAFLTNYIVEIYLFLSNVPRYLKSGQTRSINRQGARRPGVPGTPYSNLREIHQLGARDLGDRLNRYSTAMIDVFKVHTAA